MADALWVVSALLWLVTVPAYGRNVVAQGRLRTELPDPTMGPFTSLAAITLMPLGVALAGHARSAGEAGCAAGNAWFAINGGRLDLGAELLGGYAALMVLVQVSMISAYRKAPFGPGYWAFAFSYAAAFTNAVSWLAVERVRDREPLTYVLLAVTAS